jgi:hypothetical protein
VSARWRAMTRSQIRHLISIEQYLLDSLGNEIANILVLAGLPRRRLKELKFLEKFQGGLTIIVKAILRLQAAVGEDVTSGDLATHIVLSNIEFDPQMMDDGFTRVRDRELETPLVTGRECVAGTTDIGLHRSVKGSNPLILSKPKVVLCSALFDC